MRVYNLDSRVIFIDSIQAIKFNSDYVVFLLKSGDELKVSAKYGSTLTELNHHLIPL